MDYNNLPKDKFVFAQREGKIADKKLDTKPVGYLRDAWRRFKKNKSSVAAAIIMIKATNWNMINIPIISDMALM